MKAKKYSPIAALLCCIMLLPVLLTGCGSSLEGTWVCAKAKSGYPDIMIVEHDGKGSIEGVDMNWYTKNDRLYINAVQLVSYSNDYEYKFDGDFLLLDERVYIRQGSKNEDVYAYAERLYKNGNYEAARLVFAFLDDFKDSEQRIEDCKEAQKGVKYDKAAALYDSGEYEEARKIFSSLSDFKDSADREALCRDALKNEEYERAKALMAEGSYDEASSILSSLGDYKDCSTLASECAAGVREAKYNRAKELLEKGCYNTAATILYNLSGKDAAALLRECDKRRKIELCNTWQCIDPADGYPDTLTLENPAGDFKSGTGTMDGADIRWEASYHAHSIGGAETIVELKLILSSDNRYYSYDDPKIGKQVMALDNCVYFPEGATDADKYETAEILYEDSDYKRAGIVYTALGSYKDCEKKAALCRGKS